MIAVVQRVREARVTVEAGPGAPFESSIGTGLLVLLGVETGDGEAEAMWMAGKTASLRVFADDAGKMNLSVRDVGGEVLVVSQFTLLGDASKGNRPSFVRAARPESAAPMVERFVTTIREEHGVRARTGLFGADMQVALVNDGPVTILMERRPV